MSSTHYIYTIVDRQSRFDVVRSAIVLNYRGKHRPPTVRVAYAPTKAEALEIATVHARADQYAGFVASVAYC